MATDRARITEVVTYLIDNALKYSSPESKIGFGATVDDDELRLWVTDEGVGVDPDHHEAIFERFHQVDRTATRSHGGPGLGLHLAKVLVGDLGGRVEVASVPGRGSTFTVVAPMGDPSADQPPKSRSPARIGTESQFSPGGIGQLHSGL